jgi:hypothetical protein
MTGKEKTLAIKPVQEVLAAGVAVSEVAFAVWGTVCPFQHACFFDRITVASTRLI